MKCLATFVLSLAVLSASCGGGGGNINTGPPPSPISVQLSETAIAATQDGTPSTLNVTVTRPAGDANSVTLSIPNLPAGINVQITSPETANAGALTFTVQGASAGTYALNVDANDAVASGSASLSLVVAIAVIVTPTVNTSAGVNGRLETFMATSFQPADWDYTFFTQQPSATTALGNMLSQHIRLQAVAGGVPQKADQSWDFSELDAVVNPVFSIADHSPEFQIAVAPAWMDDSNGHLITSYFADFAAYSADLVKYYDTGGFVDSNGALHQSSSPYPVTYWGIFNEPNINGIAASDYVNLYNLVVPAMQSVDSAIKFVAVELADFGNEPQNYFPTFVAGVNQQVDAVALHFYSTCNQADSDQTLFDTIPGFVSHVQYVYSELRTNPSLSSVPIWVTENNVNADYDKGGGISACNGTPFVLDQRGTSAFFAAWRPYIFSQFAQAGVQALYHWDYDADGQYGEVNFNTDQTYLSYWVDYWLARYFPSPPGSDILEVNSTETSTVEILATRNDDGSVVVMLANHAVNSPGDNNGPGAPRTVVLNLSALGNFSSGTSLTLDASTNPLTGTSASTFTPTSQMAVVLGGYGVTFLSLKP